MDMFFIIPASSKFQHTHTHLLHLPESSLHYKQTSLYPLVFAEKSPHFLVLPKTWYFSVTLLLYKMEASDPPTPCSPGVGVGEGYGTEGQAGIS